MQRQAARKRVQRQGFDYDEEFLIIEHLGVELPAAPPEGEKPRILHICLAEKFIEPFIEFLESNVADFDQHVFFCVGDETLHPLRRRPNILFQSDYGSASSAYFDLNRQMYKADKIILHGLWIKRLVRLLAIQPWLLGKCHWVIWGGDLYSYQFADRDFRRHLNEFFRRIVIKRIGNLLTYVEGDVDLARQWYGARGKLRPCLMYPSNLYKEHVVSPKVDRTVNIQIGNSADPTNEQIELLKLLEPYKNEDIKIYGMLAYGSDEYAAEVAAYGKKIFAEKFVAVTDFMTLNEYNEFLGKIDVALFNHRRQQAMGNIISLLGMGKKVYLRRDISSWVVFESRGLKIFDVTSFGLEEMEDLDKENNMRLTQSAFSPAVLKEQWLEIFG